MPPSNTLNIGIARSESVSAFHASMARTSEPDTWRLDQARRYPIGWFDYDGADEGEGVPEGAGGEGAENTLPDAGKLLRHLAVVLQPPLLAVDDPDDLLTWPAPLLPYQREGVMALTSRRALLLADSMGLGKTVQAIAALRILVQRREVKSALVVCPVGLQAQWRRELAKWAPELTCLSIRGDAFERARLWQLPAHVRLVGYETLRGDVLDNRDSPALRKPWDVVILDEASRIKNRRSGIAVACKLLPRERRWALTGTPLENSIDDVASQLDFLLNDATQTGPLPPNPGGGITAKTLAPASRGEQETPQSSSGVATPAELKSRLRVHQLRRTREEVLPQLPKKQVNEIVIELPAGQREAYDRAEQEGIVQLTTATDSVTVVHVLELISRLKQICNYDPVSGQSGKLEDIRDRMTTLVADGRRALVFSQFVDDTFGIGRAADYLKAFNPLTYTGSLTMRQREQAVQTFSHHPEHKALLLSLKAGGQGLNLQAASYVFHLDRWWNPAIEEQADSRAHRLGQTYPVTIYRYICANTIEERIDAKLRDKRKLFQDVVEDASMDLSATFSEAEIFGLFGLAGRRRR